MRMMSIPKEQGAVNEDAVMVTDSWIAVSDGAGGGGVFADLWSKYLIDHIPNEPIMGFDSFDQWLGDIWEPFYNDCEKKAQREGGLLLSKFYEEGSFATLAAVWRVSNKVCHWISYGDSVAFHYNRNTKRLEYSFGALADFNNPPFLINCKDELKEDGFKQGDFYIEPGSIVFVTSDALAHYIIMMYQASNSEVYKKELSSAMAAHSKNSNYIQTAIALGNFDFENRVITKLQNSLSSSVNFIRHTQKLMRDGLLACDDFSLCVCAL